MRILVSVIFIFFTQQIFACSCAKIRNSDFKSQTKYFDLIVSGSIHGDNEWLSISNVYFGNISSDSISLTIPSCGEVFVEDSSIKYIIGLVRDSNDSTKFSASWCVTDVLIIEDEMVKVSPFNNFSSKKKTIAGKVTEMTLNKFEEKLKKWL